MIEITENQQSAMHDSLWVSDRGIEGIDSGINSFLDLLSTDQLKQLCEAKGLGVVGWIDFDEYADSSWPSNEGREVLIKTIYGVVSAILIIEDERVWFSAYDGKMEFDLEDIICWCELPQRKEN